MDDIATYAGFVVGTLIISILLSTIIRWVLKKTKLSSLTRNIIASLASPILSLLINPNYVLVYLVVAIPIFFVHQKSDNKRKK